MSGRTDPKILAERSKTKEGGLWGILADYYTGETDYPKHINEFRLLYQRLKDRGTFREALDEFETNKELPPMIRDYGKTLISLMTKERNLERKYEYFVAFTTFIDYLGGDLGDKQ